MVEDGRGSFVASEEENDLHGIEKVWGKTIPRVTLSDFDYEAPPRRHRGHEGGRHPTHPARRHEPGHR